MTSRGNVTYQIDSDDRIVFVNDEWDRFALENDGYETTSEKVLKRPIWDFISDSGTEAFYRRAIDLARRGDSVTFPFNCDSPGFTRSMEMRMENSGEGLVEFRSTAILIEARTPENVIDRSVPRTSEMIRICSWCKKVFVDGRWVSLEDSAISSQPPVPLLTHGICEDCFQIVTSVSEGS